MSREEEILAKAKIEHDKICTSPSCPKYLRSCTVFAQAILAQGKKKQ